MVKPVLQVRKQPVAINPGNFYKLGPVKKTIILITFFFSCFASNGQFSKASLQATGLTCALCSNAINKALGKLPFIQSVDADIKHSSFAIVFKPGSVVNPDAIMDAVEGAGFSVGGLELTGTFQQLSIDKDQHVKIGQSVYHFVNASNQVLNGEKTIRIVDKNFLTQKEFKKISATVKAGCLQTGRAASCCIKDGLAEGVRIYHVTL